MPAGGVATSAMSTDLSGTATSSSCGSACRRSGSQTSAFSVSLANRIFTGRGMVAFEPEDVRREVHSRCCSPRCRFAAFAQDWPKRSRSTSSSASRPASTTDLVARLVAPKLQEALGQAVLVENKPGAGGNVAAQQVKRAAPDGYTLFVTSVAYAVNPSLYANAGYDPFNDFVPVILGPSTPNIITVNPAVPAKNLQELVELARKEKLSYASSGIGTTTHLSMERIKMAAKVDITHVPYQPAQAVGAAVAGHTQISQHLDAAGGVAREGRPRARDRRHQRAALAGAARRADGERAGLLRLRRPHLDRVLRARRHAAGPRQPPQLRDQPRARPRPTCAERLAQLGLEWKTQYLGRIRRVPARAKCRSGPKAVKESGAKAD